MTAGGAAGARCCAAGPPFAVVCGHWVNCARGFGGRYVVVAQSLALTVVVTSDANQRTREGYRGTLRALIDDDLISAVLEADGATCPPAEDDD